MIGSNPQHSHTVEYACLIQSGEKSPLELEQIEHTTPDKVYQLNRSTLFSI